MVTIIKIECAWCGKGMGEKDGEGQTGISHGLCPECARKMEAGENIEDYNKHLGNED